jgi:S1-C subfamily serine protease
MHAKKLLLATCILYGAAIASIGFAFEAPIEPSALPALSQDRIDAAIERVTPSVVMIMIGGRGSVSGTIISAKGLVLTCAHLDADVGDEVGVRLADGRDVAGRVLSKLGDSEDGLIRKDLALIQMTEGGEWPAVDVAATADVSLETPLLAVGFPATLLYRGAADERPRYVRLGYRAQYPGLKNPALLETTIFGVGGDSGGGLFDLDGRLLGVVSIAAPSGSLVTYTRIDVLHENWEALAPGEARPNKSEQKPLEASLRRALEPAVARLRPAVVEVRTSGQWSSLGSLIGDGLILTKASELFPKEETIEGQSLPNLTVVLANGRVNYVSIVGTDHHRDLALLQLADPQNAADLPIVTWDGPDAVAVGAWVAAATPADFAPPMGVVAVATQDVPRIPGAIGCNVQDAKGGVEVVELYDVIYKATMRPIVFPLQLGDLVTHVEGIPIPDRATWVKTVFDSEQIGDHPNVYGEPISITFRRDKKEHTEPIVLGPQFSPPLQLVYPVNYRHTGFTKAFATSLPVRPSHCGAPVVAADGRVVGVLIARAPFIEALVIPASEVRASIDKMRGK